MARLISVTRETTSCRACESESSAAYLFYVAVFVLYFRGLARAARYQPAFAVNLTVIFTILVNGLMNSFTAGILPTLGFLFVELCPALRNHHSGERKA